MCVALVEYFQGLDILINAAGVVFEGDLVSLFPQDYDYVMEINLRAVFHLTQLLCGVLSQNEGCIVNVGCSFGKKPQPNLLSYCISKSGLEMLTKATAIELAPFNIRVNAVSPSAANTNLTLYTGYSQPE